MIKNLFYIILLLSLVSCASGKCRQKKDNKDFIELVSNLPEFQNKKTEELSRSDLEIVKVYIHDGSKQCEVNSQLPVENFKKKLNSAGIKVLKVEHKSDGMMRTQVCGSPTGMIYIFHIQKLDLKKASSLGFQEVQSSSI